MTSLKISSPKLILGLLLLILSPTHVFAEQPFHKASYLISYPRSGNNWWMYCMQELSGQSFLYKQGFSNGALMVIQETGSKRFDSKLIPIRFTHDVNYVRNNKENRPMIVMLVRNPLESIIRSYKAKTFRSNEEINERQLEKYLFDQIPRYMDYIRLYHEWDPDNRLMIYYEDLVSKPELIMKKSFILFGWNDLLDSCGFADFFKKVGWHKERSIKNYNRLLGKNYSGSFTEGKALIYHSRDISSDVKRRVYKRFRRLDPRLTSTYLNRYFK